jgi:hypothetical protein
MTRSAPATLDCNSSMTALLVIGSTRWLADISPTSKHTRRMVEYSLLKLRIPLNVAQESASRGFESGEEKVNVHEYFALCSDRCYGVLSVFRQTPSEVVKLPGRTSP